MDCTKKTDFGTLCHSILFKGLFWWTNRFGLSGLPKRLSYLPRDILSVGLALWQRMSVFVSMRKLELADKKTALGFGQGLF